jgi:hypothetical protein
MQRRSNCHARTLPSAAVRQPPALRTEHSMQPPTTLCLWRLRPHQPPLITPPAPPPSAPASSTRRPSPPAALKLGLLWLQHGVRPALAPAEPGGRRRVAEAEGRARPHLGQRVGAAGPAQQRVDPLVLGRRVRGAGGSQRARRRAEASARRQLPCLPACLPACLGELGCTAGSWCGAGRALRCQACGVNGPSGAGRPP